MNEDNETEYYTVKARCFLIHAIKNARYAFDSAFEHEESLSFVGKAMHKLKMAEAFLQIASVEENKSEKGGFYGRLDS